MKRSGLYSLPAALLAATLLTACDTTPRERQEMVRNEARNLDSLTDRAAARLKTAGNRAARFDSVSRLRNRQPLDAGSSATFATELLGTYAGVEQLTPVMIEPAYKQFLQQVRTRRNDWTQRDWDYATATYKRLNERLKVIRLDVRGRDELHIRALQAEFTAMETSRDVKDLRDAVNE
ncbi:hypothetical protein GCM10022408_32890 [Hymenobacter fastidiosus]|uniref:DUF4142 domain-containing protein n=1 Tax=Hymenobacter fastidiosus TaxID=486264 RepID=A0ABP7SV31_9BACT